MWFNLSAANGHLKAATARDKSVAVKMTRAEIAVAQRRAGVCHASEYQDCY
jgi:uncharacterized protein HemY